MSSQNMGKLRSEDVRLVAINTGLSTKCLDDVTRDASSWPMQKKLLKEDQ